MDLLTLQGRENEVELAYAQRGMVRQEARTTPPCSNQNGIHIYLSLYYNQITSKLTNPRTCPKLDQSESPPIWGTCQLNFKVQ